MDFHTWQLSFWITGQAAEQQESSPLNPSRSNLGLDIPRQIFTRARRPPCRRSRGAKDSTDRSRNIQMGFSAWMNAAWYKQDRLEEQKDLLFLMWFQRNSRFGSQVWCSTFPWFLVPYGTKPPRCHPSYCLQLEPCAAMEMSAKHPSHHQRKSLLHQTLESRAAGPRSNLLKPNCKSQTILLYYYNLSQRSLLFLWKGESKNGEKNALFQAEMTKSFICIIIIKKRWLPGC